MTVQRLLLGEHDGFEFVPSRALVTGVLFGVSMAATMAWSLKEK